MSGSDEGSRLSGFSKRPMEERLALIADRAGLSGEDREVLSSGGVSMTLADRLVENAVGAIAVPMGIATNLVVDGEDVLVPMATEESSVIAAVCNAAKRCRETGGFVTSYSGSLTIAQVQLVGLSDPFAARLAVFERRDEIARICDEVDPTLKKLGGGFREVEVRVLDAPEGPMVVVHLIVDTQDAMGANAVNSMAERLAPELAGWTGGRPVLRILSNLADRRLARARAIWPAGAVGGEDIRDAMILGARLAAIDPYRAATHNKGIMNGVSAVTLATGNDTRAIEAGAHAYAARSGRYSALSHWEVDAEGRLVGSIELPLSLGTVGGATRSHPVAGLALRIMRIETAERLARIVVAVGLAQNFGALRALADEGIQHGHMRLHAKNIAIAAGAAEEEVDRVTQALQDGGEIRLEAAERILAKIRGGNDG